VKTSANRLKKVVFSARGLRRGQYRVSIRAKAGKRTGASTLYATKL
jgi:hypothetical protein